MFCWARNESRFQQDHNPNEIKGVHSFCIIMSSTYMEHGTSTNYDTARPQQQCLIEYMANGHTHTTHFGHVQNRNENPANANHPYRKNNNFFFVSGCAYSIVASICRKHTARNTKLIPMLFMWFCWCALRFTTEFPQEHKWPHGIVEDIRIQWMLQVTPNSSCAYESRKHRGRS